MNPGPQESEAFGRLDGINEALALVRSTQDLAEAIARLEGLADQAAAAVDAGIPDFDAAPPLASQAQTQAEQLDAAAVTVASVAQWVRENLDPTLAGVVEAESRVLVSLGTDLQRAAASKGP